MESPIQESSKEMTETINGSVRDISTSLTNSFEEEDYLYGAGVTDSMLFGYDEEEDFYGFDEDETNLYGTSLVSEDVSFGHIGSDDYDVAIITSDIIPVEEYYLENEYEILVWLVLYDRNIRDNLCCYFHQQGIIFQSREHPFFYQIIHQL